MIPISVYNIRVRAKLDKASLQKELNSLGRTGKGVDLPLNTKSLPTAQKELKNTGKEIQNTTKASKGLASQWGSIAKKVVAFGAITSGIRMAKDSVVVMAEEQLKLNKSQTEFMKVSNMSQKEMDSYTVKIGEVGKGVARTR